MEKESSINSQYALIVAFQTMKERCQQLQARLTFVEEENSQLRQQSKKNNTIGLTKIIKDDEQNIMHQDKIEELNKQKSQLIHYIFMVASENRQLWKRLTWLTQASKSLGHQLTTISDNLKEYSQKKIPAALNCNFIDFSEIINTNNVSPLNNEHSLEEISLRLIDNIINEKSELKYQLAEMKELQPEIEYNFKNIGFSYPEDIDIDSLEHLKYHDMRLNQIKDTLLAQQNKLQNVLQNFKKIKKNETSTNGQINIEKLICPMGTQLDLDNSLPKIESTHTNLLPSSSTSDKRTYKTSDDNVCPLCGIVYKGSVPFNLFHEHVIDHFTKEIPGEFGGLS